MKKNKGSSTADGREDEWGNKEERGRKDKYR